MGESKHLEKVRGLFNKSPVVDFKSIERIIRFKKRKSDYAKLLVSNLLKSGEIKKIAKGYYSKFKDNGLVVLCYSPAYLGLQSALSIHGLWEQETIPVIITSRTIRSGIRKVLGGNVLIRKTKNKFIFGVEYLEGGGFYLPYSDIEKTFIDMVIFKQNISRPILREFKKKINKNKLEKYLRRYNKKTKERILIILK